MVEVLAATVFGGALFIGLRRVGARRAVALLLALLALWVVPFVLLYQSRTIVGDLVQPRYLLPLMVIAIGVASLRRDAVAAWNGYRLWLAGGALAVAFWAALRTNIQRYTTGADQFRLDPGVNAEWWWNAAPSPLVTLVGGTLAFAGVFVLLSFALPRPEREPSTALASDAGVVDAAGDDHVATPEGAVPSAPGTREADGAYESVARTPAGSA